MPNTDDPDEFRERWQQHINEFERLKHTLDPEKFDEVDEHIEALQDLVEEAAVEVDDG